MRSLFLTLAALLLGACASAPPYAVCGDTSCDMGGCYAISVTRSDGVESTVSFCTNECDSDEDCPDDGACISLEHDRGMTFFCAARCESSSDCYAGLACTELRQAGSPVLSACLP